MNLDFYEARRHYPRGFKCLTKWYSKAYASPAALWERPGLFAEYENNHYFLFSFFELYGFFIAPTFTHINSQATFGNWGYDITNRKQQYWRKRNFTSRELAETMAIIRAFELLEEFLKEK